MTRATFKPSFLTLGLLTAPLLPSAHAAQEAATTNSAVHLSVQRTVDEDDANEAKQDRGRKHVLHLTNGTFFRGRARKAGEGWEIWQKGWVALPDGMVERAAEEKDLLKRARSLERNAKGKDDLTRVAYADWCLAEGLLLEGLRELDRVFAEERESQAARSVLARHALRVGGPAPEGEDRAAWDAFLDRAARGGPSLREIAVAKLGIGARDENTSAERTAVPNKPTTALEGLLLEELVHTSARRRSFAALALRRAFPGRQERALISRSLLDASEDVRQSAALALRAAGNPAVAAPAIKALSSPHHSVRRNAAHALGNMGYGTAVAPLIHRLASLQGARATGAPRSNIFVGRQQTYVQDFDVEVAQNSSIADPIINVLTEGMTLEAASLGVREYSVAVERSSIRETLRRLTGANPGNRTSDWLDWWEEHGEEWMADSPPGPPSTPGRRDY